VTDRQLRCFVAAARARTLAGAARLLGVTARTVSVHIRALESEVGVSLFDRAGANLTLTAAGEGLARYAARPRVRGQEAASRAAVHRLFSVTAQDGVRVAVHDLDGEGAPVVLAHPMGFNGAVMGALARHLQGAHCYAPDLRGHGHTPVADGSDFGPGGPALDVLACVDRVVGRTGARLAAVGHSLGAAALVLAEAERPGTFDRLYLYEPAIMPPDGRTRIDHDSPFIRRTLRRRRSFHSLHAAAANFAAKPPMQDFVADAFLAYVEHGFAVDSDGSVHIRCAPEIEVAISMSGIGFRAFERLPEVGCPVVVARSTLSQSPGRAPFEAQVVASLPHARLEFVGPLSHFGPQQHPALVAERVQAFLDAARP
jgi:DNA-binding transcriptional LysR family regulator